MDKNYATLLQMSRNGMINLGFKSFLLKWEKMDLFSVRQPYSYNIKQREK